MQILCNYAEMKHYKSQNSNPIIIKINKSQQVQNISEDAETSTI